MDRVFYRLVESNPPTLRDFMSYKALGKPLRTEADRDIWEGLSVQNTLAQARNRAKVFRGKKTHVAVLEIPDDAPVRCERTGVNRGHSTLWATPQKLISYLRDVVELDAS
jgi:hypothetical protein